MKIKVILKSIFITLLVTLINSCSSNNESPTYPDIKGVNDEQISLIVNESKSFELSGGDNKFSVKTTDPNVVGAELQDNVLTIMAVSEGMSKVTVTSADKMKVLTVKVLSTPESGVYMGTEQRVMFQNFVQNNEGLWLLELSGNPYSGKRLFISTLPSSLVKGQNISLMLKVFNIEGLSTGEQSAMVEVVTPSIIKLKVGEYSIVIPNDMNNS